MKRINVKICCIKDVLEAKLAISMGATAIGLVGKMPSGPGIINDQQAAKIVQSVHSEVDTIMLTSQTNAASIIAHHQIVNSSHIQLTDIIPFAEYALLRKRLPNVQLLQVIHVQSSKNVAQAIERAAFVDGLLLDSGSPNAAIKTLGGTGKTHDWEISAKIQQAISIPVYLAGGLNPSNVGQAIKEVSPNGVDVCSGIRNNGDLSPQKLAAFMEAIHAIL